MTRQALATQAWPEVDLWGPHKSGRREWLHRIVLLPQTCYSAHITSYSELLLFFIVPVVWGRGTCVCECRPMEFGETTGSPGAAGSVSSPVWMLGTQLRLSERAASALDSWAISSLRNKFKRKQLKAVLNPYTPCYAQQMFPIDTDFCWNAYSLICVHLSRLLIIQTAHWIIFMKKCQLHYLHYRCFSFSLIFWKEVYLF